MSYETFKAAISDDRDESPGCRGRIFPHLIDEIREKRLRRQLWAAFWLAVGVAGFVAFWSRR